MSRTPLARRTTTAAAALLVLGLAGCGTDSSEPTGSASDTTSTGQEQSASSNDSVPLPDGFQPEGIATQGTTAYLGSRADGDLYRTDLSTGKGEIFSKGPGTPSLGLKLGDSGRLYVSGGSGGDARIVDAGSGDVLGSYTLETGTAFINDVVLGDDTAYFTDSANAQLFALPLASGDELPTQDQVRRIPLGGEWEQVEGNNANGITTTPDGEALLVVNSSSGTLYRVDPSSGEATAVDTGGYSLADGDGMLREGTRLFVVQNRDNKVAVLDLSDDATTAELSDTLTSEQLDVPSTVARSGDSLWLPNARFSTPASASTTYAVTSLSAPR